MFVGSLPPGAKPEELRRLFENYGVVTECDIINRCGFVHMQNPDMARGAIEALNNSNFKGATISVEPGRMKYRNGNGPRRSVPGSRGVSVTGGYAGFRGNNQRGGSSGNVMGRGGNAMMDNIDGGRNFNEHDFNSDVGFSLSSCPMRRDTRDGHQRNGPYNRSGGNGVTDGGFGGRGGCSNDRFNNKQSMDNRGSFSLLNYILYSLPDLK